MVEFCEWRWIGCFCGDECCLARHNTQHSTAHSMIQEIWMLLISSPENISHFKKYYSSIDVRVLDVHQCKCATWNNPNLHRHELNICIYKPLRVLYDLLLLEIHSFSLPSQQICFANVDSWIFAHSFQASQKPLPCVVCLKHLFCINSIKILFQFHSLLLWWKRTFLGGFSIES